MSSIRLGEIGKISMCKRILKSQTNEFSGIPFYKISTFGGTPTVYIDEIIYREYKEKYSYPKKGDILISAAGTIGKTVIFDGEDSYFQDSNIVWIENDESKVTNQFLYYFLQTNPFITTNGSTIKRLYNDNLRDTKIPNVPSIQQQNQITDVLGTLDKKIQINNQINQELEAMARTLYDYWFVQFDFPDRNGKPYKSSGGKMVYNPELKREIPEGWGVEKLGDLAQFKNGINYEKTSSGSEKVKIINVRNISSSTIFINRTDLDEIFLENDKSTNFIVNEGMILITRSGIPGATRLVSELEAKTVYSGFIIASEVNDLIYKNLIFYYLKNVEEVLKNQSAGTIMKNISQSVLTDMVVSLPPQNLLLKFNSIIDNLLEQMKNVQRQNQELTQLRDWLLPMLMNGQVKVE